MTTYKVTITTTEQMLGSAPADPEIYKSFIASKKHKDDKSKANPEQLAVMEADEKQIAEEEVKLLPEDDKGITVFRRNAGGLVLMDFQLRGFLKEAAEAVSGIWGVRSKIDKWLFVKERVIPILRETKVDLYTAGQENSGVIGTIIEPRQVTQPDGTLERPLRAQTMQGPRVALACSEKLEPGVSMTFTLIVLPLGETKGKLDEKTIREWLDYGVFNGLGQWRTGSNGRFTYTLKKVE